MLSGLMYIVLMVLCVGIFNFIGLTLSGNFNVKQYLLLSITPLFSSFVIYFLCLYISTFTHKTKKMIGISLGIVFLSYILQTLSNLSSNIEFLKYFSAFTLADIRNVIINNSINIVMILICVVVSIMFLILALVNYNKKELV